MEELKYELHDEWTAADIDIAVISENEHRVQLDPIRLGLYLANMVQTYGSERALAKALHKPQAWVNHRIGLTRLQPELQTAISTGQVTFKLGRECIRLAKELQPKLASHELPADIAESWLITNRIDQTEQLRRWEAGPPFTTGIATPPPPEPATPSAQRHSDQMNPGDSSGVPPVSQSRREEAVEPSSPIPAEKVRAGDSTGKTSQPPAATEQVNPCRRRVKTDPV